MLLEGEENSQQVMNKTDGSFRCLRQSLTRTEASSFERSTAKTYLFKQDSQRTMPELPPFSSRALDFEENVRLCPFEAQIGELMHRFSGIHHMLIEHSDQESRLHERKRGFKVMPIDHTQLSPDYTNKTNIIRDIVALVEGIEEGTAGRSVQEILQTKFLEYYLERHYGGLNQCHNLSIQEKLQQLDVEEEERVVVSKLEQGGIYLQSNQGEEQGCVIQVERIRIIEVEIPVMVYCQKVEIVRVEESDIRINNKIESIINRFSRPYSDLYQHQLLPMIPQSSNQATSPQTPTPSQIVASIMIDSNHLPPKDTQIELIYSDFPEEHAFKLPLDSYAQLESLISNDENSSSQLSRPGTDRDRFMPAAAETIVLQERENSSILERMEEGQRFVSEENDELRQAVRSLEVKVQELQAKNRELVVHNDRLAARLQEEIQQGEYLSQKLNEIDAQILEERVDSLTHLNAAKERRIEDLMKELEQRECRICQLTESVALLEKDLKDGALHLQQKDEEILMISWKLLEREAELRQLQKCEHTVIEIAASSEQNLKRLISNLQAQNCDLQQEMKEYRKRVKIEGISLLYDEATEIQGIIQCREHSHRLELQEVSRRYEQVGALYRQKLEEIKSELSELQAVNENKTQLLASKDAQALLARMRNERYFKEMQEVVRQYDKELEQKDEEIMALKMQVLPQHQIQTLLHQFTTNITLLKKQLERERTEKTQLTLKLMEMDQALNSLLTKQKERDLQGEERLIEDLSAELQKKINENSVIKQKLAEKTTLIASLHQQEGHIAAAASIRRENEKLRDINRRLKRYTTILQGQIKAVCRIDQCESHRECVSNLIDQKNYFCQLLTRENSLIQTSTA